MGKFSIFLALVTFSLFLTMPLGKMSQVAVTIPPETLPLGVVAETIPPGLKPFGLVAETMPQYPVPYLNEV